MNIFRALYKKRVYVFLLKVNNNRLGVNLTYNSLIWIVLKFFGMVPVAFSCLLGLVLWCSYLLVHL